MFSTTGTFVQFFPGGTDGFESGLQELYRVSNSVSQSLNHQVSLQGALKTVHSNLSSIYNGPGFVAVSSDKELDYVTGGGLNFGWEIAPTGDWMFYVQHPRGADIPEDSSLRQSAEEAGWLELFNDGRVLPIDPKVPDHSVWCPGIRQWIPMT